MKFNYLKIKDVCDFVGGSQPPKSQFIYVSKPGYVRLIQTRDYKTDAFPTKRKVRRREFYRRRRNFVMNSIL